MKSTHQDPGSSWFGQLDADGWNAWVMRPGGTPPASDTSDRDVTPFLRTYRAFLGARALLAVVLMGLLAGHWFIGNRAAGWVILAIAYATITLLSWALSHNTSHQHQTANQPSSTLSPHQALLTIGLDLFFFSMLQHLATAALNAQALLALPVLMAGVLMPRIIAMGVAAAASINLLSAAWIQHGQSGDFGYQLAEVGLTSFGLFAIAALASEVAARMAREELSARGSMALARQQAQLNRLVMEEMSDGVLVLDRKGVVRTANPAARRLLSPHSLIAPAPFQLRSLPEWHGLVLAVEQARHTPLQAEAGQEVMLRFDDGSRRDLRVRVRFTRGQAATRSEDMCMLWLEDLRQVRNRERQDKLAAMGRMSAGIAHEIRNPLAAISQANALMAEDAISTTQQRLTRMVKENVVRLQNIVDDILAVSPGARPPAPSIDALAAIHQFMDEWRVAHGLTEGPESLMSAKWPETTPDNAAWRVRFEPEHLQRILVNLLDNALTHCSGTPGAIELNVNWRPARQHSAMLVVSVGSDGLPLTAENEQSLFEPFFSTRSRGTGLGLYICRELCERHGATIDYRLQPPNIRHRNEFFVTMPVDTQMAAAATS